MSKKILARLSNTLAFAHLGLGARASGDDDDTTDDGKKSKKAKANDDDDDTDDEKKPAAREGQELDGAENAEGDEDDAEAKAKSKAAKDNSGKGGDEDDDDSDEEMRGKSAAAQARNRERARCAAIFASKAAGPNPALAANLAFNTRMTRSEAIAVLASTPAPAAANSRAAHPGRGSQNPALSSASPPQKSGQSAIDDSWAAARSRNDQMYSRKRG